MNFKSVLTTLATGVAIGIAEVIPGVSGGTIAFITNKYERLMNAIKAFSPIKLFTTFKESGINGVWTSIDGSFLFTLIAGMVVGIGIGLNVIHELLITMPPVVWAFFFGLIVASIFYILRKIKNWNIVPIIAMIVTTVVAFFLTKLSPATGSESLFFVFICGFIAISALILPGISGSFMLLMMGMYSYILNDNLKTGLLENKDPKALLVMVVFGLGAVIGMLTTSNLISWTFKKYTNTTLAALTGFMIGSLNKIWPWQQVTQTRVSSDGSLDVMYSRSVLPGTFAQLNPIENITYGNNPFLTGCIIAFLLGFGIVITLSIFEKKEAL